MYMLGIRSIGNTLHAADAVVHQLMDGFFMAHSYMVNMAAKKQVDHALQCEWSTTQQTTSVLVYRWLVLL
jgi:hypothetical protein